MRYAGSHRHMNILRLPSWQIALLLVAALAIGIAFAIVATGVFLIALPVAAIALLAYRLFGGRRRQRPNNSGVIEGEYEVIDEARTSPWRGPNRR